jgi:molecular chaperone GrpE (heat shock protein)
LKCTKYYAIALFSLFAPLLWGQSSPAPPSLSRQIENEADYLENMSKELQMSVEQVKNLETILEKANLSLNEWEKLSRARQEEYLRLASDYEKLRRTLRNWKRGAIVLTAAAFTAGALTGWLVSK